MATTSLSLSPYWEKFIKELIATGRYGSASEVVREALREFEDLEMKRAQLRASLAEGIRQAKAGEFVDDFDMDDLINDLNREKDLEEVPGN